MRSKEILEHETVHLPFEVLPEIVSFDSQLIRYIQKH